MSGAIPFAGRPIPAHYRMVAQTIHRNALVGGDLGLDSLASIN
jgi:hypothetical protein